VDLKHAAIDAYGLDVLVDVLVDAQLKVALDNVD